MFNNDMIPDTMREQQSEWADNLGEMRDLT